MSTDVGGVREGGIWVISFFHCESKSSHVPVCWLPCREFNFHRVLNLNVSRPDNAIVVATFLSVSSSNIIATCLLSSCSGRQ